MAIINGIDVSKHQGKIDWPQLAAQHKAGELGFVLIRAGYGKGTIDPEFEANYKAATAAGIPVGAYWYAYFGKYTPTQETNSFIQAVAGKTLAFGVWYDVEYEPAITGLSKKERTDKTLEGLKNLATSGRYVGLYASTDMINNRMEWARLAPYDIWVAQYSAKNTCKAPYGIWQHSSTGRVQGIAVRVDLDRAYKNYPGIVTGTLATGTGSSTTTTATGTTAPKEDHEPRVTATYRVTGEGKDAGDRLLAMCVELGLYMLGTVTVHHTLAPVELAETVNRLQLETSGSVLTIGPATRGDLASVLQTAGGLALPVRFAVDIGPVSTGDAKTLHALAAELGCSVQEVG